MHAYIGGGDLQVVIVEQGGKHEMPSSLDREHVSALRWASSSLKQTSPVAIQDIHIIMDMQDWITV